MRGSGSLRTLIGRPIYGKAQQQHEDAHAAAPAPKKHKQGQQRSKSTGAGGLAGGQKSIFNFYSVAAPTPSSTAAASSDAAAVNPGQQQQQQQQQPPRCRSAPLPAQPSRSAPQAATNSSSGPSSASQSWSSASQSDSAADASQQALPEPCTVQQQQPHQQQEEEKEEDVEMAAVPAVPGPLLVSTRVVGRQHQSAGWPPAAGAELLLARELTNPVDPCAILVCSTDSYGIRRTHGHLPAAVSCHLAPLLDAIQVQVQASLARPAQEPSAAAAAGAGAPGAVLEPSRSVGDSSSRESSVPQPVAADASAAGSSEREQPQHSAAAAAAAAVNPGSTMAQPLQQNHQQQQQQQLLQLQVTLLQPAEPQAAAAALSAVDRAAVAGLESLQPGRSSGAMLTAAFEHIMSETRQHDLHLLSCQEQAVLQHMQSLPPAAKVLLLRLLLRKRTWFQISSLAYADVPQPEAAARRLAAVGLLQWDRDAGADLDSLLHELPVVVLKQVLAGLLPRGHPAMQAAAAAAAGAASSGAPNKAAVISSIQATVCRAKLQASIAATAGPCVCITPSAAATFARLQLLYFAAPGHDINMFVAVEWGAMSYPSFAIQRTRPVFSSRQQVLQYEQALALAGRVYAALEAADNDAAWRLLQPALTALQAGVHKDILWDEACAPVPNPPPRQRPATPPTAEAPQPAAPATPSSSAAAAAAGAACTNSVFGFPVAGSSALQHVQPAVGPGTGAGVGQVSQAGSEAAAGVSCDLMQASSSDMADGEESCQDRAAAGAAAASVQQPGGQQQQQQEAQCSLQAPSEPAAHRQQAYSEVVQQPAPAAPAAAAAASAGGSSSPPSGRVMAAPGAAAGGQGGPGSPPPPLFFARFCAGWVHASLGTVAVSLLERQKRWQEAVELLRLLLGGNACVGRRGDWWTRLAINLEHLGRTEDALESVEAALADAWVRGGDLLGLQRRYLRLGKPPRRWRRPAWAQSVCWEPPEVVITARPLTNNTGTKSKFYAPDDSLVTVEELALQHYASEEAGGWQGLHCEGGVWATLFTLLLWDVIFMGVPDVFRSPFQTCPLDLDTDAFYPARRTQLDAQLTRIADGHAGAILSAVWGANAGVMARGVNWQRFSQEVLQEICDCVGGLGLAAVLRLMAEDHAGATGGLPDLLLWRPSARCTKCVEVKGPRDRLSHQQRFWLAHMADNTMQVEVLKVKEPRGNKRK